MSNLNISLLIQPQDVKPIFQTLKQSLLRAAKPEYHANILEIKPPERNKPLPLYKLLSKMLQPFRTQKCGGFEVSEQLSQQFVEKTLQQRFSNFDGLLCGVEASVESIIDVPTHSYLHRDEAIVYPQISPAEKIPLLSKADILPLSGYPDQSLRINRYSPTTGSSIWMGHISSGTTDPQKFPHNRAAFLRVVSGELEVGGQKFNPNLDISFWDVNFDCTDAINREHALPSSLERLLSLTSELPIQFIIPAVRVRKQRIANRPFANNQLHKGGIEQLAESMIGTCPRGLAVKALDSDGLFVLSEGKILQLMPASEPKLISAIAEMEWKQYSAFSSEVLLDHKPILAQIGSERFGFYNFMDFKGKKGIARDFWYDENILKKKEQEFLTYLKIWDTRNSRRIE